MYFASDYHEGLGGYDIVYSEVINGNWMLPQNPGYGVNSPADDYFPAFNKLGELYITSNRLGGRGKNDIYKTLKLDVDANQPDEYADIPPAVNLDDLAVEVNRHAIKMNPQMFHLYRVQNHLTSLLLCLNLMSKSRIKCICGDVPGWCKTGRFG